MLIYIFFVLTRFMFKRVLELTTASQPKYIIGKMRKDDQSTGDVENGYQRLFKI